MGAYLLSVEVPEFAVWPAVGARRDPVGEGAECFVASDAAGSFPGVPAAADVDVQGWAVAVEAVLEEPVGFWRPGCRAALPFGLASFFVGDPSPGTFEVCQLDAFQEAEQVETGRRARVVHVFDSMMMGVTSNLSPDRFHLLLTADGRETMHGWWSSEATARRKFTRWVGEYSDLLGARVTLVDETTGETLTEWPGVVGGAP